MKHSKKILPNYISDDFYMYMISSGYISNKQLKKNTGKLET